MTRINCIPVADLTDQHLVAEYRETNLLRLRAKLAARPCFYRYGGCPVGLDFYGAAEVAA